MKGYPTTPTVGRCGEIALDKVANLEKKLPADFIGDNGLSITEKCRDYLLPLIAGEDYPPYRDGLPALPVHQPSGASEVVTICPGAGKAEGRKTVHVTGKQDLPQICAGAPVPAGTAANWRVIFFGKRHEKNK